jgi:hypothetical protein
MDRTGGVCRSIVCIVQCLLLAGCGGESGGDSAGNAGAGGAPPSGGDAPGSTPPDYPGDLGNPGDPGNSGNPGNSRNPVYPGNSGNSGNSPPIITGSPPSAVLVDSTYDFMPSVANADGDTLTFSITNAPPWARLNPSTGRLSGKPGKGDLGTYHNVVISVSDGATTTSTEPFSIAVVATAPGSVTLSWHPPTERVDGSPLLNALAGHTIYWGRGQGLGQSQGRAAYTESVKIANPGVATYTVENLTPGRYYFVVAAFDVNGVEGDHSNAVSTIID